MSLAFLLNICHQPLYLHCMPISKRDCPQSDLQKVGLLLSRPKSGDKPSVMKSKALQNIVITAMTLCVQVDVGSYTQIYINIKEKLQHWGSLQNIIHLTDVEKNNFGSSYVSHNSFKILTWHAISIQIIHSKRVKDHDISFQHYQLLPLRI